MGALAAAAPVVAARVLLGVLWLGEGFTKYRAGFGSADILLVADSAVDNSRVPDLYAVFAGEMLGGVPALFGFAIPLLETCLGIAFVLGILTLPASGGTVLTLMTYWLADQLTGQYPLMVVLAAVILIWPDAARQLSLTELVSARVKNGRIRTLLRGRLRCWL